MSFNKKIAWVSPVMLLLLVTSVEAKDFELNKIVEAHKEEVLQVSEQYSLLPSIVMSEYLLNSNYGLSNYDVSEFAKGIYTNQSETNEIIASSGSADEVVAQLFKSEVDKDAYFVSEMNNLLSLSSVSGLDNELYSDGLKPVIDYSSADEAIEEGSEFKVVRHVSLSNDALVSSDVTSNSLKSDAEFRNLCYVNKNQLKLLSNGNKNKSWWQFWKSGYLKSDVKVLKDKVEVSDNALKTLQAELDYFNVDVSGSVYKTNRDDIFAYGDSGVRALFNKEGLLIGLFAEKLAGLESVKNVFNDAGQIVQFGSGYLLVGYRTSSLFDKPLLESVEVKEFNKSELREDSVLLNSDLKVEKQFYFEPLSQTLYLVRDGENYLVVTESGTTIGYSSDSSKDSVYSCIKTGVGNLWITY